MKKVSYCFFLSFMILIPFNILAQNSGKFEYSNSITIEELKDHVYFFASDDMDGRLPGSKQFDIAADYATKQFKQSGLKPICMDRSGNEEFKQLIHLDKYEISPNDSLIVEKNGKKIVYSYPTGYSYENIVNTSNETLNGEVVFVGYGINEPDLNWNDFEDIIVKDKWIVMFYELDGEYTDELKLRIKDAGRSVEDILERRDDLMNNSEAKGVIYVLEREDLDRWNVWIYNYGNRINITGIAIDSGIQRISAGIDFLNNLFQDEEFDPINKTGIYTTYAYKNLEITLNKSFTYSRSTSSNIVAYVEGFDPVLKDEFIILGAHLDHFGKINGVVMNGADDNASGCAAVLEIAETIALSNPKRSVAFILFTGEEFDFFGSKYFIDHSPIDLNSIQLYINLDMIGRYDGDASDVFGYTKGHKHLNGILNKANSESAKLKLDYTYDDSIDFIDDSDHYLFYKNDVPIVHLTSGINHTDRHKSTDDAEKIDFELIRNVSELTYNLIMEIANKEESLRVK